MVNQAYINAYEEYRNLPNYQHQSSLHSVNEIYNNKWCVILGRAITPPHPHRKWTLEEFVKQCEKNEALRSRFVKLEDIREDKINSIL